MNKLELKYLVHYLPYGLKCNWNNINYSMVCLTNNERCQLADNYTDDIYGVKLLHIKPILRPLSDITKEIEVNGEKFVPIVKLLKLSYPKWFEEKKGSRYEYIGYDTDGYPRAWVEYQATLSIMINTSDILNEKYWIIQKLYEWHFAIDIPQDLYIDINTI